MPSSHTGSRADDAAPPEPGWRRIRRWARRATALLLTALVSAGTLVLAPVAYAGPGSTCTSNCVTTYDTPPTAAGEGPFGIVRGPLHSQWFTYGDAVARIDDSGTLTRYPLPTAGAITRWMTSDNHGRVWFTEFGKIGWITVDGDGNTLLREYALPYEDAGIISLVLAPNHRAYFSEQALGKIGSIDIRTGAYREYDLPSSDPLGLTLGPDGALWYTDRANAKVGRITLDGRVREWSLPPTANLQRIVTGPDRALWFTDLRGNTLWRITTGGTISPYPMPGGPVGISVGGDRQLYLTLFTDGDLVRVDLHGNTTGRWDLPGATFALQNAPGRGYDVWATDNRGHVYRVRTRTPATR